MLHGLHGFRGQKYWVATSTSYKKVYGRRPSPSTPLLETDLDLFLEVFWSSRPIFIPVGLMSARIKAIGSFTRLLRANRKVCLPATRSVSKYKLYPDNRRRRRSNSSASPSASDVWPTSCRSAAAHRSSVSVFFLDRPDVGFRCQSDVFFRQRPDIWKICNSLPFWCSTLNNRLVYTKWYWKKDCLSSHIKEQSVGLSLWDTVINSVAGVNLSLKHLVPGDRDHLESRRKIQIQSSTVVYSTVHIITVKIGEAKNT